MTALHRSPEAVAHGFAALTELRELAPSLVYAAIVTDDGFELTHVPENGIDRGRIASMTSSVQALGEAVARELSIGGAGYVVISAEKGYVLQQRIPGQPLILAALFDTHEMLGKGLSLSRRITERLSNEFASLAFQAQLGSTDYSE